MSIKIIYTKLKGLIQETGSGVEINGNTSMVGTTKIVGPQPRTGTNPQTEPLALTVSGSMGVEVSNNSSFIVQVPRQSKPAIHVRADISHVRVGIGCEPATSVLHVSSSADSGGMMFDGNPGDATYLTFRKQAATSPGGQWSFVHRGDSTPVFWFWGYDGSTYKNAWKFDYDAGEMSFSSNADYGVIIGDTGVDDTAQLEVTSTTKGFLPPRLTDTQRDAITGPATGLTIYNTTTDKLNFYNGSAWRAVDDSAV